jgi:hypothetical protein
MAKLDEKYKNTEYGAKYVCVREFYEGLNALERRLQRQIWAVLGVILVAQQALPDGLPQAVTALIPFV